MMHHVFPDKEKAKSIFNLALDRIKLFSPNLKHPNFIIEIYYEIIKEMSSALLLLNGIKFIGENAHGEIINSLSKFANFSSYDISVLQDLRSKRNYSLYEGKKVQVSYVENYGSFLENVIDKLKKIVEERLK